MLNPLPPSPSPPPLPVRALEYDTSRESYAWRGLSRGIGVIMILVGGGAIVAYGGQLLADLFGWADPFYRKYRNASFSASFPSLALMIVAYAAEVASGTVGVVAGIVCVARRPWSRGFAVAYAVVELGARACMTANYISSMGAPASGPETWLRYSLMGAYVLSSLAFPSVLLLLTRHRAFWSDAR